MVKNLENNNNHHIFKNISMLTAIALDIVRGIKIRNCNFYLKYL